MLILWHSCVSAGMPVTSVRELRVLQSCRHPNLVELKKVVTGKKLDRCRQRVDVLHCAALLVLTH